MTSIHPTIGYTADLTDEFFRALRDVCIFLGARPDDMLAVMMSESGVRASARNPNGNASGLIQFMPATLKLLGYSYGDEAFRKVDAEHQMIWVRDYFSPHRGRLISVAAIYVATFLPALVSHAHEPDFVLTAKSGPLGWAYAPNAVFDTNRDYAITVRELEDAVLRNCRGPRWLEIVQRLNMSSTVRVGDVAKKIDTRTTRGIQEALRHAGCDPGPIDGIPGPLTHAAVIEFQTTMGLKVDGIVGPLTRAALDRAVSGA